MERNMVIALAGWQITRGRLSNASIAQVSKTPSESDWSTIFYRPAPPMVGRERSERQVS
jgi:hypothetical protein